MSRKNLFVRLCFALFVATHAWSMEGNSNVDVGNENILDGFEKEVIKKIFDRIVAVRYDDYVFFTWLTDSNKTLVFDVPSLADASTDDPLDGEKSTSGDESGLALLSEPNPSTTASNAEESSGTTHTAEKNIQSLIFSRNSIDELVNLLQERGISNEEFLDFFAAKKIDMYLKDSNQAAFTILTNSDLYGLTEAGAKHILKGAPIAGALEHDIAKVNRAMAAITERSTPLLAFIRLQHFFINQQMDEFQNLLTALITKYKEEK
jgi:hypothetical protein